MPGSRSMGLGLASSRGSRAGTGAGAPVPGSARVAAASVSSSKEGAIRSANRVVSPSTRRRLAPKVSPDSTSSMRPGRPCPGRRSGGAPRTLRRSRRPGPARAARTARSCSGVNGAAAGGRHLRARRVGQWASRASSAARRGSSRSRPSLGNTRSACGAASRPRPTGPGSAPWPAPWVSPSRFTRRCRRSSSGASHHPQGVKDVRLPPLHPQGGVQHHALDGRRQGQDPLGQAGFDARVQDALQPVPAQGGRRTPGRPGRSGPGSRPRPAPPARTPAASSARASVPAATTSRATWSASMTTQPDAARRTAA